jgi:hypothetical protein
MNNDAANSIYVGTDIGVFVTNDTRTNWIMYNSEHLLPEFMTSKSTTPQ